MTTGAFITITRPYERGDLYDQCREMAEECFDEVIIIDGRNTWPQEFDWKIIGEHFQAGYEELKTDWVFHLDCDFIFHEQDFDAIREACATYNDQLAFTMLKRQFVLPDRFNLKSRLVVAVNKGKFGDRIRFDSGGDFAQPSLDGKYIEPGTVPDVKIPIWNYEKLLKTKEQIADDQGRMERAWQRHFGYYQMGSDGTDESAYERWYKAQQGKFNKPQEKIKIEDHPAVMIGTIKNLKPEQFGYNGFGLIEGKVYG